jgi:hypothetical protein
MHVGAMLLWWKHMSAASAVHSGDVHVVLVRTLEQRDGHVENLC